MCSAHADFAPSSDDRIYRCPASWALNRGLPDADTVYSAEGTFAHKILDECNLNGRASPWSRLGYSELVRVGSGVRRFTVTEEMANALAIVQRHYHAVPGEHFYEQRVDVSEWTPVPDQFGTLDNATLRRRVAYIRDLKYGKGVRVDAYRNRQIGKYALPMIRDHNWSYGFEKVVICVLQPRLNHYDYWETTPAELQEMAEETKAKMVEAMGPNPLYGPTEHGCKFCKARGCAVRFKKSSRLGAGAFSDLDESENWE